MRLSLDQGQAVHCKIAIIMRECVQAEKFIMANAKSLGSNTLAMLSRDHTIDAL